ncbi:hypothetical protein V1289_003367 [Bradyrhizobium sp. AZCC 2289]
MADTSEIKPQLGSAVVVKCGPAGPKDKIRRLAHRPPRERYESAGHFAAVGYELQLSSQVAASETRVGIFRISKSGHVNRKDRLWASFVSLYVFRTHTMWRRP